MNDIIALRKRLAAAAAAIPIGAASMLTGCADTEYQPAAATTAASNGTSETTGATNTPNTSGTSGTTGTSGTSGTTTSTTSSPPRIDPDCPPRDRGELTINYEDGCYSEGEWDLPLSQAAAMANDACSLYWTVAGDEDACPPDMQLRDVSSQGDYRARSLYMVLQGQEGDRCYYYWYLDSGGCVQEGRALTSDEHEALVAELREGSRWLRPMDMREALQTLSASWREAIGMGWLWSARYEHASVASFARTTLELMAHGAPPALLAAAQQAGIDEVNHARDCFAIASAYLGRPIEPERLESPAPRYGTLAELAVETFREGVIGETVATLAAERSLAQCGVAPIRDALEAIIADEAQHAALAWATVRWAIAEGGAEVQEAVLQAAAELRQTIPEPPIAFPANFARALRFHGRLEPEAMRQATLDAWDGIIDPMLAELTA